MATLVVAMQAGSRGAVFERAPYTWTMDVERWLSRELATFACAACGEPYGETRVRLIAHREELHFVDLACHHCGTQAVAIVTILDEGDSATLDPGELVPAAGHVPETTGVKAARPVSADDVIDVHQLLEVFDGDVEALMARFDGGAS